MIEAIAAMGALDGAQAAGAMLASSDLSGTMQPKGFTEVFEQQLGKVNQDLAMAETSLQKLAAGEPIELHDVMISLETARISVQTMIQVRNRLVDAYQEVMRMQI